MKSAIFMQIHFIDFYALIAHRNYLLNNKYLLFVNRIKLNLPSRRIINAYIDVQKASGDYLVYLNIIYM